MREILFRGKMVDDGTWTEGFLFSTKDHTYIAYQNQFDDDLFLSPKEIFIEVDPKTVCQYTGLTDKNGRKIFEGDIVKSDLDKIGKIAFNESHMALMILESRENRYYYVEECDGNHIEIIGNIFDNPELIGE